MTHDFTAPYVEGPPIRTATPFLARTSPDGREVVVEGLCPRCQGPTASPFPLGLPGAGGTKGVFSRLVGRPSAVDPARDVLATEVFFCECGYAHPQQPTDVPFAGCGASWRVVAPPPGGDGA
ncbi:MULTISPECIES: hypothetical protein [Streptomyces]|uniref:Uncharacterized protein n=1 Tax=Streptomyces nondiastaticus TaxID=3154512 RepID=A0ABW6TRL7_9ACTN|nr:hypothetical protein [Streptomyces sp. VNUA116]WKU47897.1 hypothetical protein Q3V23_29715 [Streptomyces sp. VNUA116]